MKHGGGTPELQKASTLATLVIPAFGKRRQDNDREGKVRRRKEKGRGGEEKREEERKRKKQTGF